MSPGNRIILNTLATYGQSVIVLVLGLFSARWTLMSLGQIDFGLFGLVGGLILLLGVLSSGLSVGVVRFYAISIGRGEKLSAQEAAEDLKLWFQTALTIHLFLPLLVLAIGWPLGEHAIRNWLTIPPSRLDACLWIFRSSLATAFITVVAVPFVSMFHAQQRMVNLAIFGIAQSAAVFALAWRLRSVESDRLVTYGTCMMLITVLVLLGQMIRASVAFPACRPSLRYLLRQDRLGELFSYCGWKMFGMACVTLREQGTPILANLAFGPLVNAAYSIANRLSSQASGLSSSLLSAFQPALTAAEGKGDRRGVLAMAIQVCNFGTLLVALFAIPLILEMDSLLKLWLVDPPPHTASICRWLVAMLIIDKMTAGPMIGVNAHGKIAVYEMIQGPLFLLALPLMWLFIRLGHGPAAIGPALFASHLAYCAGRIVFARTLIAFPVATWLRRSVLPLAITMAAASAAGFMAAAMLNQHLLRLLAAGLSSSAVTILMTWLWILSEGEKMHAAGLVNGLASRFRKSEVHT